MGGADAEVGRPHPAAGLAELPDDLVKVIAGADDAGEEISTALQIAVEAGQRMPSPGSGQTLERWAALAALGRANLTVARVTEAHTDALAILAEAGRADPPPGSWGVFAAETPNQRLRAETAHGEVRLSGVKPWCSLADNLDRALVTAHVPDGRQLFEIDLHDPRVAVEPPQAWVARGLRTVTSVPIRCTDVPARPVGAVGWYLTRDGFAWGGIGVAACWYGGALGLADRLYQTARGRQAALDALQVGTVDVALHSAASALIDAAAHLDGEQANGTAGALLALRVRAVVANAAETVLRHVGHALGPAPLAFDAAHAARVGGSGVVHPSAPRRARCRHARRHPARRTAVIAFDHRAFGTPAAAWQPTLDAADDLASPAAGDHLVVVAAHPDDETLGAGGLLALASSQGTQITVIVACDGEASHPTSPTHGPETLARLRRREVRAAVEEVAPKADIVLLGLPDGRLAEHRAEITASIDEAGAGCTHLVTPWAGDGHPDHAACADAATRSVASLRAQHWQFPIWAWHWGDPNGAGFPALGRLRLDAEAQQAKARALACHVSQHRALSDQPGDEPVIGPHVLDHFRRDVEMFVVPPGFARVPDSYFANLYDHEADPWGLADRYYEQRKRALVLAALTRPRFRRAFEPGCATGLLTAQLAHRCGEVVAWDLVAPAVEQARARVAGFDNVTIAQAAIPDHWPDGDFDLIVLSEVGYYCTDLNALALRVAHSLAEDGVVVACHWRHDAAMHPQTADAVHRALAAGLHLQVDHVEHDFLLQVWSRRDRSVAAAEGIVA